MFSALVKLRDAQTIKYTQAHAIRSSAVVEGALIAACMPTASSSAFLGYGDAPAAAAFAANPSLTIADLWASINDAAACDETLPEEDETFFAAYLFADMGGLSGPKKNASAPVSAAAKAEADAARALQNLLIDRDSRKYRRQQVVLGAIALMLLHDLAIFDVKKAAASAPSSASVGKSKLNKVAQMAAQAAAANPLAKRPFLSVKYGLTPAAIAAFGATAAPRYYEGSASSAGGAAKASAAAVASAIAVLSAMAAVVAEFTAAIGEKDDKRPATEKQALLKTATGPSSPARTTLAETLRTALNLTELVDPTTASANAADPIVSGAAFPFLFPLGIALSSFLMLMPYPAESATAFKDGILKNTTAALNERLAAAAPIASSAEADAASRALAAAKVANLRSFTTFVEDLLTDVNASSRRKQ